MSHDPVVVIGDALIDEFDTDTGVTEHVGGAALNVAVGLATLSVPATLVAMVGDDDNGAMIRRYLADHGVELIATRSPLGSARAVSYRVNGEPHYTFNAAAQGRRIDVDEGVSDAIAAAGHVVISCFPFDRPGQIEPILDAIDDPARSLIIDPNPRTGMMHDRAAFVAGFEKAAHVARLVKIGDEDAALLYQELAVSVADRLHRAGSGVVLTTAGRDGAELRDESGKVVTAPIADDPSPIIDTMGAGDATTAAMTAAIVSADAKQIAVPWDSALRHAMDIAAATCRAPGALLRIPHG